MSAEAVKIEVIGLSVDPNPAIDVQSEESHAAEFQVVTDNGTVAAVLPVDAAGIREEDTDTDASRKTGDTVGAGTYSQGENVAQSEDKEERSGSATQPAIEDKEERSGSAAQPAIEDKEERSGSAAQPAIEDKEDRSESDTQPAEEEDEEECGFCIFMKGGPCKDQFIAWQDCVDGAEKSKKDIVQECAQVTNLLKTCMELSPEYYGPLLEAEKAMEAEVNSQQQNAENERSGEAFSTHDRDHVVEDVEMKVEATGVDDDVTVKVEARRVVEDVGLEAAVEKVVEDVEETEEELKVSGI